MARLATALALCAGARAYVAPVAPKASSALKASPLDGLEGGQVPLGNWDPLNLADTTQFGPTLEWYRAAELKHCRVAMAAFVGMVLQANGWVFPGNIAPGVTFKSCVGATPLDTWDNVPLYGKYQIIAWVGLMEVAGEMERPHYMTGGKGGTVFFDPPAKKLSLWDPLKSMKNWDDAKRKRGRLVELQKLIVEGGGASGLAALLPGGPLDRPELKGKKILVPLCGGNIDTTTLSRVIERGLSADGRLVRLDVAVSDRPGGIAELTKELADLGASVKDIFHERAWLQETVSSVYIRVILETMGPDHNKQILAAIRESHGTEVKMDTDAAL